MVALKLGAAGCMVSSAAGAGDCYAGALLARLSAGDELPKAARAANVAAALSTQGYGAVAPLPRLSDVLSKLG